MRVIELSEARGTLAEYAEKVQDEPLVITQDGKPVAMLAAVDDMDLESISLSTNPDFLALLERSRASLREHGGIPSSEMRRLLDEDR